jgi:LPPG:FO 2-phospho-L-lactate transferase
VIAVLSGGVGAARLLRALRHTVPSSEITAIVNVGDDLVMHGLTICPDLDTITYTLAGLNNEQLGWGLAGESWRVMDELAAIGGETWFRLGDRDLATHLYRSQRLANGATKSEVAAEMATRLSVGERLIPVSDDDVATVLVTDEGELSFQDYFVRRRHDVTVSAVRFVGAERARPAPGVIAALSGAQRILIAPSNPIVSIDPILAVPGVRNALAARRDDVVAISPIIGGAALKGPADRLLRELGHESSCVGVARYYAEIAGRIIIDEADADAADRIERLGVRASVTSTVMGEAATDARLSKEATS